MTKRKFDSNGWYEIKRNPISRVGVYDYLGIEIGAPDPHKIYKVRRSTNELSSKSCLDSFKMIPIVDKHDMIGPNKGSMSAEDKGIGGVTGQEIIFDDGYMLANIKVYSDKMADQVNAGINELSCGYSCDYVARPGTDFGQAYDYDQINIRGNHVAVVEQGRMGKSVKVLDQQIFTLDSAELITMKKTQKQIALASAIANVNTVNNTLSALDQDTLTEEQLELQLVTVMGGMDNALQLCGMDKDSILAKIAQDGGGEEVTVTTSKKDDGKKVTVKKGEDNPKNDPEYKKGMDAVTDSLKMIADNLGELSTRMTSLEDGQGQAAMDARIENVDRAVALDAVMHITGPVVHAEMTNPEFYAHLNGKCGIDSVAGSEKLCFDSALKFLPKKTGAPSNIIGLDDASKSAASSFFNQNDIKTA
jgi:hypothetical protein